MADGSKKFKLFEKLKNIKHIEIYISIIFIIILILIYMSNFKTKSQTKTTQNNEMSVTAYVDRMQSNLADILSNIGGVSDVKVMITLNMDQVEVVNGEISIAKFPEIKGVVVTANGVNNTATKLKVLHAIEAVLEVTNGNIEILSSV